MTNELFYCTDVDAMKYGLDTAIVLNKLASWIRYNKAHGQNLHEGRTWMYDDRRALGTMFPFIKARRLGRIIRKQVEDGVLMTGCFNKNSHDRTMWYAFTDEVQWLGTLHSTNAGTLEDATRGTMKNKHEPKHEPEQIGDSKKNPPPTAKKQPEKAVVRNEFTEAFKTAFNKHFDEPYKWHKADFVQFKPWHADHPDVTPEQFAALAEWCWGLGEYVPVMALTIKGLCAGWPSLCAKRQASEKTADEAEQPEAHLMPYHRLYVPPEETQRSEADRENPFDR